MIVVLTGPSGVGKSTIIKSIKKDTNIYFSISSTTRPCRVTEIEGEDYFFINNNKFNNLIDNDLFIEYEEYGGYMYGTTKDQIDKISTHKAVVLDLEVNGAIKILNLYKNSIGIFIDIDNDELVKRLKSRGDTDNSFITKRIQLAEQQRLKIPHFKHYVVNTEINTTVNEINDIIYNRIL